MPLPAPEPVESEATVVIERLTATEFPPTLDRDRNGRLLHDYYSYVARFLLRETGGISGAAIRSVLIGDVRGGGDLIDDGCWDHDIQLAPGGTVDTFYTDDGIDSLYYCDPTVASRTRLDTVRVTVTFTDRNGVAGTVKAEITPRQ